MIRLQFFGFLLRWLASSIGMYFCLTYFATVDRAAVPFAEHYWALFAVAGLVFSVLNSIIKPIVKMLALPLAILTLGLSTFVINTVIVILTIYLIPGVEMDIPGAIISSVILSVVNGLLNFLIK